MRTSRETAHELAGLASRTSIVRVGIRFAGARVAPVSVAMLVSLKSRPACPDGPAEPRRVGKSAINRGIALFLFMLPKRTPRFFAARP